MKLRDYAKQNSVCYQTAWNHFKKGLIPNAKQLPNGTVVIVENQEPPPKEEYTVLYARVSSNQNKANLEEQMDKLRNFCIANGWKINEEIKECASGINDNRTKLSKIFKERKATRIIVEHKSKLTFFGFNYIKLLYPDCNIVIINDCEDKQELLQDLMSLITNFCSQIYGKKIKQSKIEQLLQLLK